MKKREKDNRIFYILIPIFFVIVTFIIFLQIMLNVSIDSNSNQINITCHNVTSIKDPETIILEPIDNLTSLPFYNLEQPINGYRILNETLDVKAYATSICKGLAGSSSKVWNELVNVSFDSYVEGENDIAYNNLICGYIPNLMDSKGVYPIKDSPDYKTINTVIKKKPTFNESDVTYKSKTYSFTNSNHFWVFQIRVSFLPAVSPVCKVEDKK
jgi:hypothetical protein